ncbi:MAG: hypothetical protein ACI308_04420 [Muribaculaceae bacterium]
MKRIIFTLVIALTASLMAVQAQQQEGRKERKPLTEEQITQLQAERTAAIKQQLQLTAEQEAPFDKEYCNYNNIVLATRTKQFKNHATRPTNADEALATINDGIDSQIVELAARKQMLNNLKESLNVQQLMLLWRLTSMPAMGGGAQPNRESSQRRNNNWGTSQQRQRNTNWGDDFAGGSGDDDM